VDGELLTIGAMSERTGVAPSALRFYEAEGLIRSTRSAGGQRRFARDTIRRVSFIRVAKEVGLSLEEIRAALASLPEERTPNRNDWERLSAAWRPRLDHRLRLPLTAGLPAPQPR
jgi:MerR family redox-sensitive transcriptional activator SoxR